MTETALSFPTLTDHDALELGTVLAPRFDAAGLITAVVVDAASRDVVMVAHMNAEALARTIETGIATYWSRSRGKIWVKGETSGNLQRVRSLRVDCDQDAVLLEVEVAGHGASCHRGYHSCFYRAAPVGGPVDAAALRFVEDRPAFDAGAVYGDGHGHDHGPTSGDA
ncbi:phosphoribosyl-AMP cyclohydrolase [Siculibacillus lacustris]|uniref:Phosphoribosyl-AMP cyclohydrolase n=1 Tax=Siculibacillus lacustris TaxID=1549641 RepID=A0A4Q9VE81_9HYPH|nr:phosphoribosyl-AMP cyclohydrolase [Siculibacillus lacustris]TBW33085.1 phosphoribosyl-AMP cyclohydrolase [Siculibacillus lacustris]